MEFILYTIEVWNFSVVSVSLPRACMASMLWLGIIAASLAAWCLFLLLHYAKLFS